MDYKNGKIHCIRNIVDDDDIYIYIYRLDNSTTK